MASPGTCTIKVMSVSLAGRFAGLRGLDLINLVITTNARGGPRIVLASVAFDAGIISSKFYTTLVIAAVLTSQFAGAWLDYVMRKGWPLLRSDAAREAVGMVSEDSRAPGGGGRIPRIWAKVFSVESRAAGSTQAERSITRNPSENSSRTSGSASEVDNSFSIRRTR
jgi:Kef-type K+ transport system membrane component KefB